MKNRRYSPTLFMRFYEESGTVMELCLKTRMSPGICCRYISHLKLSPLPMYRQTEEEKEIPPWDLVIESLCMLMQGYLLRDISLKCNTPPERVRTLMRRFFTSQLGTYRIPITTKNRQNQILATIFINPQITPEKLKTLVPAFVGQRIIDYVDKAKAYKGISTTSKRASKIRAIVLDRVGKEPVPISYVPRYRKNLGSYPMGKTLVPGNGHSYGDDESLDSMSEG